MTPEVQRYRELLSEAIAAATIAVGGGDAQELCRALRGVFPLEVKDLIWHRAQNKTYPELWSAQPEPLSDLPEPHPVDFDWRFDIATADALAELGSSHGEVLCLGTPTVFQRIVARGGCAHLIDHNPLLTSRLKVSPNCTVETQDIADLPFTHRRFGAAVVDPPWYPACYEVWLSRALQLLKRPSVLYLTVFRDLTRPGADVERADLFRKLSGLGEVRIIGDAVYSTPVFEAEVLKRVGLPQMQSWRVADIARIDIDKSIPTEGFYPITYSARAAWERFRVGGQVVAVNIDTDDDGAITYVAPRAHAESTELLSVSRRDPSRDGLTVWTSRNRAVIAKGTAKIAALLATSSKAEPNGRHHITRHDRITFHRLLADLRLELPEGS